MANGKRCLGSFPESVNTNNSGMLLFGIFYKNVALVSRDLNTLAYFTQAHTLHFPPSHPSSTPAFDSILNRHPTNPPSPELFRAEFPPARGPLQGLFTAFLQRPSARQATRHSARPRPRQIPPWPRNRPPRCPPRRPPTSTSSPALTTPSSSSSRNRRPSRRGKPPPPLAPPGHQQPQPRSPAKPMISPQWRTPLKSACASPTNSANSTPR